MANTEAPVARTTDPLGGPIRERRFSPSLRTCLFGLTIVTVLPLVGLFGLKGYQDYRTNRAASLQRTLEVARGMRQSVEAQLCAYIEGTQVLADTSTLADGNMDGFARRAQTFVSHHPGTLLGVIDPSGLILQVFEAGRPVHHPQGLFTTHNGVARAVETRRPAVSDFFVGAYRHQPSFSINVPVERDGKVIYVLSYNPTSRALQALISEQHLPPDWVISIFDSGDVNVARVPNDAKYIGKHAADLLDARLASGSEGVFSHTTPEGTRVQTAFSHTNTFGWSVAIGVPEAELLAPLWQSLVQTAGLGVIALLLSGWAAYVLGRRVLEPVHILVRWATTPNAPKLPASLGLREADDLAQALQTAAQQREAVRDELRTLFDISPVGIVRTDPTGRILEANDAFLRLSGTSRTHAPADGLPWQSLMPPHQDPRQEAAAAEFRERGYCDAYEGELLRPDGTHVPVLTASALLDRQTGHTARFAVDLGRAKRAEAALLASEARAREQLAELAFIYDTAPVGLCVLDRDLRYVRINERLAEIHGQAAIEHLGRTVREIVPGLADQAETLARRILETGAPALGLEFSGETRAQPGVIRTLIEHWLPHRDAEGQIDRINVVAEEITERKRIERALAESEARLRLSQEAAGLGAWDWNRVTGAWHWTPQQFRLLGLDPATAGPPCFTMWLNAVHPDDRAILEAAGKVACAGLAPFAAEFRVNPPESDTERWIHTMGETIRDAAGVPVRVLGVTMDITERRQAENDLRRLAETLEERVGQEMAARENAQMQLVQSQRMEALGKLAGGIAHDFNNVLQAVAGGLEFIQRRTDDAPTVERFATLCSDAVKRGSAITSRLLTFARSGTLQAQPIAPGILLQGLKEMLAPLLGVSITMVVDADPGLPRLLADRDQLETALVNLSLNARDAMPDGGTLRLAASLQPATDTAQSGAFLRLDVSDTGTGMDAATLARASEPFYTTKPIGKGTGLGLSMARGFVEQSGGRFAIDSAPNRGTTVSLWLPGVEADACDLEPLAVARPEPAMASGHVLLVDDDAMVATALAAQLEAKGYIVRPASDAAAALADMELHTPDLLLTDFAMPGMDGLALIQEVRRRHPSLPAILLTGYAYANEQLVTVRREQHTTRLLRKPVLADELAAVIAELLDARRDSPRRATIGA